MVSHGFKYWSVSNRNISFITPLFFKEIIGIMNMYLPCTDTVFAKVLYIDLLISFSNLSKE